MGYYDTIAPGYDELHEKEQRRKLAIITKRLAQENLQQGPLLDVGCGTGFCLDLLAEQTGKEVVGTEPSEGMRKQYRGARRIDSAAAEALPYPDGHFAAVVSVTAIQNFKDVAAGVSEMRRVVKDDAPIIISCLKKSPKLKEVSATLADNLVVEEVMEEDKDLIYCCRKRSP